MQRVLLLAVLFVVAGVVSAGMMGGGMMGPGSAQGTQSPENADQATRKGYAATQEYCMQCHQLPSPQQHTAQEWPRVVSRMEGYMQRQGRRVPSPADSRSIIEYLEKSTSR